MKAGAYKLLIGIRIAREGGRDKDKDNEGTVGEAR